MRPDAVVKIFAAKDAPVDPLIVICVFWLEIADLSSKISSSCATAEFWPVVLPLFA